MWTNRGVLHQAEITFTAQAFYELGGTAYYAIDTSNLGLEEGDTLELYANGYYAGTQSYDVLPPQLQGYSGEIQFSVTVVKANGTTRRGKATGDLAAYDPCNGQGPPNTPQIYIQRDPMQDWVNVSISYGPEVDTSEFYVDEILRGQNSNEGYYLQLTRGQQHILKLVVHHATNVDCKSQAQTAYEIPSLTDIINMGDNVAVFEVDLVNNIAEGLHLDWPSPIEFVNGSGDLLPRIYPVPSPFVHIPKNNGSYIYFDGAIKVHALRYPSSPVYDGKIMMLRHGEVDSCLAWRLSYVEGFGVSPGSYLFAGHTGGDLWLELAEGQGYPIPVGNISATYTDMQGLYRQPGADNYPPIVCWRDFSSRSWYSFQYKSVLHPREVKLGAFAENGALLGVFLLQDLTYYVAQNTHMIVGGRKPTGATIPANTFFVSVVEVKIG